MDDLTGKATNDQLTAAEWNQVPAELQNVITSIVTAALSGADVTQLRQAITGYAGAGNFFSDVGVADAWSLQPIASRQGPIDLLDGYMARFRPANASTGGGSETLNITTLTAGAQDITREGGVALSANDLVNTQDAIVRWNGGSSRWELLTFNLPAQAQAVAPRGYIDGLTLTRVAAATIRVNPGFCRSIQDDQSLSRGVLIDKTTGGTWVIGSTNPGLFSGVIANNEWYHQFLIRRNSDGVIDSGFTTDPLAADRPALWDSFRRIGSFRTNGSAEITEFIQYGDYFIWDVPYVEYNASITNTTVTIGAQGTPPDVPILGNYTIRATRQSFDDARIALYGEGTGVASRVISASGEMAATGNGDEGSAASGLIRVMPTVAATPELYLRTEGNSGAHNHKITCMAYTDTRGKE